MSVNAQCPVCNGNWAKLCRTEDFRHHEFWECDRCGSFNVKKGRAKTALKRLSDDQSVVLSGWVFERDREGSVPELTANVIEYVARRSQPPVSERMDRLLLEAARENKRLGQPTSFEAKHLLAASHSRDERELRWLVDALTDRDLLKMVRPDRSRQITPAGYDKIDDLKRRVSPSGKAFVAMSFAEEMEEPFANGLSKGILDAGFDPVRVDRVEHVERIDDKIIALINESAFVVADFTGHRGGVYFEAGYALGRDLPVIWTCKESNMKDLHFDIRQYNTIDWEDPEELARRLTNRIEATVGKGPNTTQETGA